MPERTPPERELLEKAAQFLPGGNTGNLTVRDEFDVGPQKFGTLNTKYETGGRLTNNPQGFLGRHEAEGPTYTLSPRLEGVVQEVAERIKL